MFDFIFNKHRMSFFRLSLYIPIIMAFVLINHLKLTEFETMSTCIIVACISVVSIIFNRHYFCKLFISEILIIDMIASFFIIFFLASKVHSAEIVYPDITVKINRVYDGDTIFVDVPNIPDAFGKELGIRIRGIDTPEIKGTCDKEKQLALTAKDLVVKLLEKENFIVLTNIGRDRYFRLDADIILKDGSNVADILLKAGLAYSYDGQTSKQSWCD